GGRRAFFFLRELARQHDVHAVFPQDREELTGIREGYEMPSNVVVHSLFESPPPKTIFDRLPKRIGPSLHYRWLRRSLDGPAATEVLQSWHLLRLLLRSEKFDVVIFDHIQMMMAARLVARWSPDSIRMLNAHNVDYTLFRRLAETETDPSERRALSRRADVIHKSESGLANHVHGYWACSDDDHRQFEEMNNGRLQGYSIANGIATEVLPFDARPSKREDQKILFCGSLNYEPNRRGLVWFQQHVWPTIKQQTSGVRLVVIGYGAAETDFMELRSDPSVDFIGEVESVPPWYHKTSMAVVPILEGSGTRVKILEAMTLGNPVVSTIIGAEGIQATDGKDILLRDQPAEFAEAVQKVLADQALFDSLQANGRHLVDTVYDWRIVGDQLNATIDDLLQKQGSC
ncbi:MAG: glycosyltransferase family 4 protein, partial [Planctomycetales bacterium]